MKLKKKGNKLFFLSENDIPQLSLGLESEIIIDISKEKIKFVGSKTGAELDWAFFTLVENDNGDTKLKADFADFKEFATYFQEEVFFLVSGGGGGGGNLLGGWDASANDPFLTDGIGNAGDYYIVNIGGTQDLGSGAQTFAVGESVVYSQASIWLRVPAGAVSAWGGITGDINDQADLIARLNLKANLVSPSFTGTPTAPTPLIADTSTKIATTEFVKSLLNSLEPVTVGAGGQFSDLNTAYSAGYRSFFVIGNCTQNNFIFAEDVKISIKKNVILTFTPNSSAVMRLDNPLNLTKILILEGEDFTSQIKSNSNVNGSAFFSTSGTNNLILQINGVLTIDFIGASNTIDVINSNSRITDLKQKGFLKIKTPTNLACGITGTSFLTDFYAENLIFEGLGTTSGLLTLINKKNYNIKNIYINGAYSPTIALINITGGQGIVEKIYINPNLAQTTPLSLSGFVENIVNPTNSQINVSITSDDTTISNANLGLGLINVNSRINVKLSKITANSLINKTETTVLEGCIFNSKLKTTVADYVTWSWTIARSGFSVNIASSATLLNFFQYFLTGITPPTPTLALSDAQLKQSLNFTFNIANPLDPILIFPTIDGEVEYKIRINITGSYSGTTTTVRILPFDLQRVSDGSLLGSAKHIKDLGTNTITSEFIELTTRTIGAADNFSVTGIRLPITQNTGATLTLNSVQFYISGRVIKLN